MKCPECGFVNRPLAKYCKQCAAFLNQDANPKRFDPLVGFFLALFTASFVYSIFPVPLIEDTYWGSVLTSHWICKIIVLSTLWAVFILIFYYIHYSKAYKMFNMLKYEFDVDKIFDTDQIKKFYLSRGFQKYFYHPYYRIIKKINQSFHHSYADLTNIIESENYKIELNYTLIRFFIWAIPILGFIGTVAGIALSVSEFSTFIQGLKGMEELSQEMKIALGGVTKGLASAFNTTFLALIMILPLMLFSNIVQKKEEEFLLEIEEFVRLHKKTPAPQKHGMNIHKAKLKTR